MNKGNVKFYKNKDRSKEEVYKPYTPQYQLLGIEPQEYGGKTTALPLKNKVSLDPAPVVSRARRNVHQPYAEAVESPVGIGRGPIPNVGNNMEHTWSTVDGDADDIFENVNPTIIDNNDFVSDEVYSTMDSPKVSDIEVDEENDLNTIDASDLLEDTSKDQSVSLLKDYEQYVLIVNENILCAGDLNFVQGHAKLLAFGEHELFEGVAVPIEEIVIFKRIAIKVGLFLE